MKLLSVYYTHKPGGLCKRLYRALKACSAAGHEATYLTLDTPDELRNTSVKVHLIPFPLKKREGALFWIIFSIWIPLYLFFYSLIRRPGKTFVFHSYYAVLLLPITLILRVPNLIFIRALQSKIGSIKGNFWISIFQVFEKYALSASRYIVCTTKAMREELLKRYQLSNHEKIDVLYNDIQPLQHSKALATERKWILEPFLKENLSQSPAIVILCAGIIEARKNLEFLILSWKESELEQANAVLLIAGTGPEEDKLRKLVQEQELKRVFFLGWCADLINLMRACDVLVHPSRHEGMSNAVLEALGSGLIVFCSDIEEQQEMITERILRFSLHSTQELSEKLKELKSPELFRKYSELSAQEAAKFKFDWEQKIVAILAG